MVSKTLCSFLVQYPLNHLVPETKIRVGGKYNKKIAIMLVVAILFCSVSPVRAEKNNVVTINGYDFYIIENDEDEVIIEYKDGSYTATVSLDLGTDDISISEKQRILFFEKETASYNVEINEYNKETSDYNVVDNKTHKVKHYKNRNGKMEGQLALGGSIAITVLIKALLTVAAICVIAGVTYYAATKVIAKVKEESKKNKRYYYYACISGGKMCIGNAMVDYANALVYAKSQLNSTTLGVYGDMNFLEMNTTNYDELFEICYAITQKKIVAIAYVADNLYDDTIAIDEVNALEENSVLCINYTPQYGSVDKEQVLNYISMIVGGTYLGVLDDTHFILFQNKSHEELQAICDKVIEGAPEYLLTGYILQPQK